MLLFTEQLGQMRVLTDTAGSGVVEADPGLFGHFGHFGCYCYTVQNISQHGKNMSSSTEFIPAHIPLQLYICSFHKTSSEHPNTSCVPRGSVSGQSCSMSLLINWLRGSSAPLANSWTVPRWAGVLICWSVGRLCRGIWTGWMDWKRPEVWGSTGQSARHCSLTTITQCSIPGLEKYLESCQQERIWGCWSTEAEPDPPCAQVARPPLPSWPVSETVWQAGLGKWLSSCTQHCFLVVVSSSSPFLGNDTWLKHVL